MKPCKECTWYRSYESGWGYSVICMNNRTMRYDRINGLVKQDIHSAREKCKGRHWAERRSFWKKIIGWFK